MSAAKISASVILVRPKRDGTYEFLLMKRKKGMAFAQAHVFPGGKLDPGDSLLHWGPVLSLEPEIIPGMYDVAETELNSLKIAAVRETFEESGIFLGTGDLGPPATGDFLRLCKEKNALPDLSRLHLFNRTVTPRSSKRRYDATFFLAFVPEDTQYVITAESESATWVSPLEALNLAEVGEILLEPPQAYIAILMAHHPSLEELKRAMSYPATGYPVPIYGRRDPAKPYSVAVVIYGDDEFPDIPGLPSIRGKRHRLVFSLPGIDFEISPGLTAFFDSSRHVLRKDVPHRFSLHPKSRL